MVPPPIRRKLVIVGDGACGKTSLLCVRPATLSTRLEADLAHRLRPRPHRCVFAIGEFPQQYVSSSMVAAALMQRASYLHPPRHALFPGRSQVSALRRSDESLGRR